MAGPSKIVRKFSAQERDAAFDTRRFLFSPSVVADPGDGSVRLAHSVLITDEVGATDHHQTEVLSDRVWAKKVFVVSGPSDRQRDDRVDRMPDGELLIFGGAKQIQVNGRALEKSEPLVSTGWTRAKVPGSLLRAGKNEFVLAGGGSLLIDPGPKVGRSLKSIDGGKTWSATTLGRDNNQQGEYLARLRLAAYTPRGWAMSPVFDFWAAPAGQIAVPGRIGSIHGLGELERGQPAGTQRAAWLRTGSTPSPEAKSWTEWLRLDKDFRPDSAQARHRWAQLKFDLATDHQQATPRLPASFQFAYDFQADRAPTKNLTVVAPATADEPAITSVPFVYQAPSPRLKLLRERYQLDKVIEPGKTELEQLTLLRYWVRNQWHTAWGGDAASWMPPWDALMILESKDQPDCLTMCTHYAAVFTQCCLALGWNARHCILDHHCVSEVWMDQHRKWVMMDPGNSKERADVGLHFERKGVPMSALELHLAGRTGQTDDIVVCFTRARLIGTIAPLCRPAPLTTHHSPPRPDAVPLSELRRFPVCQLENYRRYAFPGRNNFLASLYPGELYQGWSHYFYDGYWWVGDSPENPQISPEYSLHLSPSRPQDIDWSLNWVRAHLSDGGRAGELQVDLETLTPNLSHLEIAEEEPGAGNWKQTPAQFTWKLKPGKNELRVRSVNRFGRAGQATRVEVRWTAN